MTPPGLDEFYVAVFGPGIGESTLVHIGDGEWIVVDSCVAARTTEPAALKHLERLGVSPSAIRLVVATHWHDDHIRGISHILSRAGNATFVCSAALNSREFDGLLNVSSLASPYSGLEEMRRVHDILRSRSAVRPKYSAPKLATEGRLLHEGRSGAIITALSPSDGEVWASLTEIREVARACGTGSHARAVVPNRNLASVVLLVEWRGIAALLGADMEVGEPGTGWSNILATAGNRFARASVFKVAHHGSPTAHDDDIWQQLLTDDSVAIVTPYRRGKTPLPRTADIARLCKLSPARVFMTAPKIGPSSPPRDHTVDKMMRDAVLGRRTLVGDAGPVAVTLRQRGAPVVSASNAQRCCQP